MSKIGTWGEKYFATLGGIACIVIAIYWKLPNMISSDKIYGNLFCDFQQTYITVAAIFVGVLTAANANFVSQSSEKIIKILEKNDFIKSISIYYTIAIFSNMGGIVFSMSLLIIMKLEFPQTFKLYMVVFWFFIVGGSLFSFLRISYLYGQIINKAHLF